MPNASILFVPAWAFEACRPYGVNPLGEPLFRVVRAELRTSVIGGYWEDNGIFGFRIRPRYPGKRGFVLERWLSGRHYGSPSTWVEQTITPDGFLACGPYPANGVYECCCIFDRILFRPDTLTTVLRNVYANRCRSVGDARAALAEAAQSEETELDRQFEEQWDASHGVRRGLSFTHEGVLQNSSSDIEEYKARLAASSVKLRKENFRKGFSQGTIDAIE